MPKPSRWPRCVTRFGVVPICRALAVHGVQIAPRTYWAPVGRTFEAGAGGRHDHRDPGHLRARRRRQTPAAGVACTAQARSAKRASQRPDIVGHAAPSVRRGRFEVDPGPCLIVRKVPNTAVVPKLLHARIPTATSRQAPEVGGVQISRP